MVCVSCVSQLVSVLCVLCVLLSAMRWGLFSGGGSYILANFETGLHFWFRGVFARRAFGLWAPRRPRCITNSFLSLSFRLIDSNIRFILTLLHDEPKLKSFKIAYAPVLCQCVLCVPCVLCANMLHERVPGRSTDLWEGCLVTERS
jgi:hypothetical protein